jgi:hypothetical protein
MRQQRTKRDLILILILKSSICILQSTPPSGDGGYYRNTITVLDRCGFLLQVANILVVEVHIYEGTQFSVISIEVATQVGMLGNQVGKGLADRSSLHFNRRLFPGVLA